MRIYTIFLGQLRCVRFHSSENIVATGSVDCTAKVTDFRTGKVLYTSRSNEYGINSFE